MKYDIERLRQINKAIQSGELDQFVSIVGPEDIFWSEESGTLGSWLHKAAGRGNIPIVNFLLDKGVDINLRAGGTQCEPIIDAVLANKIEMVRHLISRGAALITDDRDRNPVLTAVYGNKSEILGILRDAGIDLNVCYRLEDGDLENALAYAEYLGRDEMAEQLRSYGCRLPIEGVDIPVNEDDADDSDVTEVETDEERSADKDLRVFMQIQFGKPDEFVFQEICPVIDETSIKVHAIQPNEESEFLTLFTTGLSEIPLNVPEGFEEWKYAELVMHLPKDWKHPGKAQTDPTHFWPVQQLRQLAYTIIENETWIAPPATIITNGDPPEPVGPGFKQTCFLLLANSLRFNAPAELSNGNKVQFFTVIPLFESERDYEFKHGAKNFLELALKKQLPVVVERKRKPFV